MFLKLIELHEIFEKKCARKSMGFDNIAPKIVKWPAEFFAPILLIIFNKPIDRAGTLPSWDENWPSDPTLQKR